MKEKEEERKRMDYLWGIIHNLPESPGIYQYRNEEGTIIYVGKAKNLKRRVSSYFNKGQQSAKTRMLVSKIQNIRHGSRLQVIELKRGRHVAERGQTAHRSSVKAVTGCCCRSVAVTVEDGGNESSVHISRITARMIRLRGVESEGLIVRIVVPVAFDMQPVRILRAAAETVPEGFGVIILKCF